MAHRAKTVSASQLLSQTAYEQPLRTVSVALAPLVCYSLGAAARPDHHAVAITRR